jgi:hypothetical protein
MVPLCSPAQIIFFIKVRKLKQMLQEYKDIFVNQKTWDKKGIVG